VVAVGEVLRWVTGGEVWFDWLLGEVGAGKVSFVFGGGVSAGWRACWRSPSG